MSTSELISRAQNGNMQARFELSIALIKGKGIKKDAERGMTMIHQLIEENYEPAMILFEELEDHKKAEQLKRKNESYLDTYIRENHLTPIKNLPSLTTLNSIGFGLRGKSKFDLHTQSFETTHFFLVLFLPVIPTARYRVIRAHRGYQFLGKVPLEISDWIPLFLWIFGILIFGGLH